MSKEFWIERLRRTLKEISMGLLARETAELIQFIESTYKERDEALSRLERLREAYMDQSDRWLDVSQSIANERDDYRAALEQIKTAVHEEFCCRGGNHPVCNKIEKILAKYPRRRDDNSSSTKES